MIWFMITSLIFKLLFLMFYESALLIFCNNLNNTVLIWYSSFVFFFTRFPKPNKADYVNLGGYTRNLFPSSLSTRIAFHIPWACMHTTSLYERASLQAPRPIKSMLTNMLYVQEAVIAYLNHRIFEEWKKSVIFLWKSVKREHFLIKLLLYHNLFSNIVQCNMFDYFSNLFH